MSDLNYYDQWNPEICKPPVGACWECNGLGYDPYKNDCPYCNATGFRLVWRWRWYLRQWRLDLSVWWFKENFIRGRCVLCGKIEYVLWIRLSHDDEVCTRENLPF